MKMDNDARPQLPDEGTNSAVFVDEDGQPEPIIFTGFRRIAPSEIARSAGGKTVEEPYLMRVDTVADMNTLEEAVVKGQFRPVPGIVTQFVVFVATWHGRLRRA